MDNYTVDVEWTNGGTTYFPIRAVSLTQAKALAGATLIEENVYAMRSARLRGGPKPLRLNMPALARGRIEWEREESFGTLRMPAVPSRAHARTLLMPKFTEFNLR